MKVAVIGKKAIYHDRLGALRPGAVVEMDDKSAQRYLAAGAVERYETKVVREVPFPGAGEAERLSALPAAQASPQPIVSESESGEDKKPKKRGRSSRSTPHSK